MQDIKQWCRIVCITVIVSGLLLSLVPESKLKKSYKGFISLLTVFLFVSPLTDLMNYSKIVSKIDFQSDVSEKELLLENSYIALDCAEDLLDGRLNEVLNDAEFEGYCETDIKENNGKAYIDNINIFGEFSSDEETAITSLINEILGGDIKIEFVG